jgi:Fic family protein
MSARFMDQRDAYYAALERTSSGDLDITPWLLWFLDQVEAAIKLATNEGRSATLPSLLKASLSADAD